MQKIQQKLPEHSETLKTIELQHAIATMITEPNEKWNNLRTEKYLVPRLYFQNNWD
jgi:hypothetical protein